MTKKPKQIPVKIIKVTGETALVEFTNPGLQRGYIPAELIDRESSTASLDDLEAATPYGEAWEDLIRIDPGTPRKIAEELRQAGIFTKTDLDRDPRVVTNIFQKYLRFEVGELRRALLEVINGRQL